MNPRFAINTLAAGHAFSHSTLQIPSLPSTKPQFLSSQVTLDACDTYAKGVPGVL